MFRVPEKHRMTNGALGSDSSYGKNGVFIIPFSVSPVTRAYVIASDGEGWEHVSVHMVEYPNKIRTPTWDEMCRIKNIFWDEEDCTMQLHPPKSQYVNHHPHVLHIWRPVGKEIPQPPKEFVG